MTNEERILKRLEAMEERLACLQAKAEQPNRLLEIIPPISADAFKVAVEKLQVLHGRVELDDFLELGQKAMLGVPNILWALSALDKVINFCDIMSPAIKPAFLDAIMAFDKLEKENVFTKLGAAKDAAGTVLGSLSEEDIKNIGNSLAFLMQLMQKLADPKVQDTINCLIEVVESMNLEETKPVGMFGLLKVMNDPDVKKTLGIATSALKEVGKKI